MFARNITDDKTPDLHLVPKPAPQMAPARPGKFNRAWSLLRQRAAAIVAFALVFAGALMPQLVSHASTAITIDTDVLFGSVNDWIATFLPIFAIGLGIAIALAIIAIVGDSILQGLRRGIH